MSETGLSTASIDVRAAGETGRAEELRRRLRDVVASGLVSFDAAAAE
jgi:hypothetical protein